MLDLIETIVKALVHHPDRVQVGVVEEVERIVVSVHVEPSDAGVVIGRKGFVVRAIRQIAGILGYRQGKKVYLDIVPE